MIDASQQKAAKLAGFAYLFTFAMVIGNNFGVYARLNVPGNAIETAKNILANETLFRCGILADLVYAVGFTVLLSSFFVILEGVHRRIALLAALWHLIYVITWVALTLKFLDALRLISGANYLNAFTTEQLSSLSKLFLGARFDRYYGGLMFYALGSTIFSYLWFKSKFIPKPLAVWGMIACAWCTVCAMAYLISPPFENVVNVWLFDLPMAFFDITLSFWLLIKGLREV